MALRIESSFAVDNDTRGAFTLTAGSVGPGVGGALSCAITCGVAKMAAAKIEAYTLIEFSSLSPRPRRPIGVAAASSAKLLLISSARPAVLIRAKRSFGRCPVTTVTGSTTRPTPMACEAGRRCCAVHCRSRRSGGKIRISAKATASPINIAGRTRSAPPVIVADRRQAIPWRARHIRGRRCARRCARLRKGKAGS